MEPKFKSGDKVFCNMKHTWFVGTVRTSFKFQDSDDFFYCVVVTTGRTIMCPPENYLSHIKRMSPLQRSI